MVLIAVVQKALLTGTAVHAIITYVATFRPDPSENLLG
jgi:hypothetical protein